MTRLVPNNLSACAKPGPSTLLSFGAGRGAYCALNRIKWASRADRLHPWITQVRSPSSCRRWRALVGSSGAADGLNAAPRYLANDAAAATWAVIELLKKGREDEGGTIANTKLLAAETPRKSSIWPPSG